MSYDITDREFNPYVTPSETNPPAVVGITLLDLIAVHAPRPAPDWFYPNGISTKPEEAESLNSMFGVGSENDEVEITTFTDYYDQVTRVWNDAAYAQEVGHDAETPEIPAHLKDEVYAQQLIIDTQNDLIVAWQENFDAEKYLQWPWQYAYSLLVKRQDTEDLS